MERKQNTKNIVTTTVNGKISTADALIFADGQLHVNSKRSQTPELWEWDLLPTLSHLTEEGCSFLTKTQPLSCKVIITEIYDSCLVLYTQSLVWISRPQNGWLWTMWAESIRCLKTHVFLVAILNESQRLILNDRKRPSTLFRSQQHLQSRGLLAPSSSLHSC